MFAFLFQKICWNVLLFRFNLKTNNTAGNNYFQINFRWRVGKKTLGCFLEFLVRPEYNLIYDFCTKKWRFPHEESISLFLLLGSWCVGSNFSCVESTTFYWEKWSWQKLFFALLRDAKFGMIWYDIYHIIPNFASYHIIEQKTLTFEEFGSNSNKNAFISRAKMLTE